MPRRYVMKKPRGKRGPYKKWTSKDRKGTSLVMDGKVNYYQVNKLKKEIMAKYPAGMERDQLLAELGTRVKSRHDKNGNLTVNGFWGQTKWRRSEDKLNARDRMLANMGLSMEDIYSSLGENVDPLDLEWLASESDKKWAEGDPITFKYNGDTYMLQFEYTGLGYRKLNR